MALAIVVAGISIACGSEQPASDASLPADTSWVLSAKAFGPVQIGMTRAQAEAALGTPLAVAGDSDWKNCGYVRSDRVPRGARIMVEGGTIARVDVDSGAVATAMGARIGDTEARIQKLYPSVASTPAKYTPGRDLTVRPDSQSAIVFETDGSHVTRYRAGRFPPVGYVEGCG